MNRVTQGNLQARVTDKIWVFPDEAVPEPDVPFVQGDGEVFYQGDGDQVFANPNS